MQIFLLVGIVGLLIIGVGIFSVKQSEAPTQTPETVTSNTTTARDDSVGTPKPAPQKEEPAPTTPPSLTLDLSNQNLTKTPSSVFEKTRIQHLNLSHNKLTGALQAEVRHLSELRTLDLSNNEFTGVPAEIGQLKYLETLDLSHNKLTGLPYELGNLSNLKILDLRGNAYATADLEIIKKTLPSNTDILVD